MTNNILLPGAVVQLADDDRSWILAGISSGGIVHLCESGVPVAVGAHRELRVQEFYGLIGLAHGPQGLDLRPPDGHWPDEVSTMGAHVRELFEGVPIDGSNDMRPEYDPAKTSVESRCQAKIKELASFGRPISRATLFRYYKMLIKQGLPGLNAQMNGKTKEPTTRTAGVDPRLLAVIHQVVAEQTQDASRNAFTVLIPRIRTLARTACPDVRLPSDETLADLIADCSAGQYTTGHATTRRSAANSPKRSYSQATASRPGALVEVDSTPFPILVRGPSGVYRPHLTLMIDVATRAIVSWAFHPEAAKGVDHTAMLAYVIVGRRMVPGRVHTRLAASRTLPTETMKLIYDVLDDDSLALPYIFPEEITIDGGKDFRAEVLMQACLIYGITVNLAAPRTPTQKAHVERVFRTIREGFLAALPGYTGKGVEDRGKVDDPVLTLEELETLFELWVTTVYMHTPHDGLRDPHYPNLTWTPAQRFAALFRFANGVRIPYGEDDFINLLPVEHRRISDEGVRYQNRTYTAPEIRSLADRRSTMADGKWPFHYDPYNPAALFFRHPETHAVITLVDRALNAYNAPFQTEISDYLAAGGAPADPDLADNRQVVLDTIALIENPRRREAARRRQHLAQPDITIPIQPPLVAFDDEEPPDLYPLWNPEDDQ